MKVWLMVERTVCPGTDFPPTIKIGAFSTREKAEHEAQEAHGRVDGVYKTIEVCEAEVL